MNQELLEILRNVEQRTFGQHHHARRGWVQFDCPFCGKGSSKFHLGLNLRGGYFNCFVCGPVDTAETLAELLNISKGEAVGVARTVKGFAGQQEKAQITPVKRQLVLPYGLLPLSRAHKEYLQGRGFDHKEIIKEWNVMGLSVAPPLSHRLFIPIFDRKGSMVSWTTRSIAKDVTLRYVSAKATQELVDHKTILYGEHKIIGYNSICVVEGPVSAWAIGTGCVATCGVGFKREQAKLLARYHRVFVCFDAEPAAQRRAKELCDYLSPNCEVYNIVLSLKDPAEVLKHKPKEIKQLRRKLR